MSWLSLAHFQVDFVTQRKIRHESEKRSQPPVKDKFGLHFSTCQSMSHTRPSQPVEKCSSRLLLAALLALVIAFAASDFARSSKCGEHRKVHTCVTHLAKICSLPPAKPSRNSMPAYNVKLETSLPSNVR